MRKIGYARSIEKQQALIKKTVKLQCVVIIATVVILMVYFGAYMGRSVFIGGFCAFIPNVSFAIFCFRYRGAQAAKKIVTSFYLAEVLKFVLVFSLLIVSFSLVDYYTWLKPVGILAGFIIVYTSIIFMPKIANNK